MSKGCIITIRNERYVGSSTILGRWARILRETWGSWTFKLGKLSIPCSESCHISKGYSISVYRYLGIHPRKGMDIALQNWSVPCKGWALSVSYIFQTPPNLMGLAKGFSGTTFEEKMTNRRLKNLSNSCWVSMKVQCQGCNTRSHQVRVETTNCGITELVVSHDGFKKKSVVSPRRSPAFFWGGRSILKKKQQQCQLYINPLRSTDSDSPRPQTATRRRTDQRRPHFAKNLRMDSSAGLRRACQTETWRWDELGKTPLLSRKFLKWWCPNALVHWLALKVVVAAYFKIYDLDTCWILECMMLMYTYKSYRLIT